MATPVSPMVETPPGGGPFEVDYAQSPAQFTTFSDNFWGTDDPYRGFATVLAYMRKGTPRSKLPWSHG